MTKAVPMTKVSCGHNWPMMTYLKVMYYFGYLPISWTSERDPDYFEVKFRISNWKTLIMLSMDLMLSLLVPTFFYLIYTLNVDTNGSLKEIFDPNYYLNINDGVETTAVTQMAYVAILIVGFWAYTYAGQSSL